MRIEGEYYILSSEWVLTLKKKRKYLELDFSLDFLSFVHAVQ